MLKLLWAALGLSLILLLCVPHVAHAQSGSQVLPGGCGTASYTGAGIKYPTQDSTGHACVSVSGSLTSQSNTNGWDGAAWQKWSFNLENTSQYAGLMDCAAANSVLCNAINSGVATPGSAIPSTSLEVAGSDGTNARNLATDSTGHLSIIGTITSQWSSNNAAATPHICGSRVYKHITSATDTQIVAASGSTNIYVCDIAFSASGALNFYLEKATSGTCATLTQIDMLWTLAANEAKAVTIPFYQGLNTGASAQLCVNTSAGNLDIVVTYDQY